MEYCGDLNSNHIRCGTASGSQYLYYLISSTFKARLLRALIVIAQTTHLFSDLSGGFPRVGMADRRSRVVRLMLQVCTITDFAKHDVTDWYKDANPFTVARSHYLQCRLPFSDLGCGQCCTNCIHADALPWLDCRVECGGQSDLRSIFTAGDSCTYFVSQNVNTIMA